MNRVLSRLTFSFRTLSTSPLFMSKRVAIILSGCGVYDGSEIHEASSSLIHLSRHGASVEVFAPDMEQNSVMNHLTGEAMPERRNVLVESARIARGNIKSLANLKASNFDALVIPGGFGAAKNLSDFATNGVNMKVLPLLSDLLKDFYQSKKVIGLMCISPVLVARCLSGVTITLGQESNVSQRWPYYEATEAATSMGASHVAMEVSDVCVDEKNKIVTTPAFMYSTDSFHRIYDGVGKLIDKVMQLC